MKVHSSYLHRCAYRMMFAFFQHLHRSRVFQELLLYCGTFHSRRDLHKQWHPVPLCLVLYKRCCRRLRIKVKVSGIFSYLSPIKNSQTRSEMACHTKPLAKCGAPSRIRTCNLRLRRPTHYPVVLWVHVFKL